MFEFLAALMRSGHLLDESKTAIERLKIQTSPRFEAFLYSAAKWYPTPAVSDGLSAELSKLF